MTDAPTPMPGVTPHITIPSRGGEAALEFYGRAFGAVVQSKMLAEDGERLMHAHLIINGGGLLLHDEFPEHDGKIDITPVGVTLHLEVDDADAWWDRALAAGAVPVFPLSDQFWGARYGQVKDPFGHCWSVSGPVKAG
ncbi:VOC family protein [Brevundimonas sp.]|uniref:VOC family protein n=1 Tax=Brevundimonas sp. TaxID=1871086 RepID=UPI003D0E5D3F